VDLSIEIEAMRLFEHALTLPLHARDAWLHGQSAAPAVIGRVRELLAREGGTCEDFLETPPDFGAHLFDGLMPRAGDRLGAWRIERELDAGGMGVVFLATRADDIYEQQAAIKLVRAGQLPDPARHADLIARFENERRLLARLDHPNIARILDGGSTAGGVPYLVMEYIDGRSLTDHCTHRRLDIAQRIALFAKVCDGVQAAHRHLIVPRDLKPQNILVDADGEPRLLDFGIARVLQSDAGADDGAARTALQAMTPAYASPEQVRHEPLTTASDVYSLGVILYELLAGVRPYRLDGTSPARSEQIICDTTPVSLRKALASAQLDEPERRNRLTRIGGDLERIVAKALHKQADRRYGSAQALADDLRRHLDGRPVLAHPDSAGYRLGKFVRRHRLGSAAALLALLAIVAAAGVAFWQAEQARRSADDAREINAFLIDVLEVSNPYTSGSEITLSEALDEAAEKVDERFGDRPDLAASIRYSLGHSMLSRYRLEEAEVQLQRSLADAEREFGGDHVESIGPLTALASLRKEQGRIDEAKQLYADALSRLERSGQGGLAMHARILNDLAVVHLIQEEFEEAQAYLLRARDHIAGPGESISVEERAQTLGNLAHAARGLGRLDEADALYADVQKTFESKYPEGGPYLAIVLNNRARLARDRKQPEQAMGLLEQAVAMHRRSFKGDHVMVLVPMTNLARQAIELGRADAAATAAESAVAMADRLYQDSDHHYHANALTTLAEARLLQGSLDAAADAVIRARTSLASLEAPPASSVAYTDGVVERLCANPVSTRFPICKDAG
jgi:tetratricopeptide (TPR) repeat protein